MNCCEIISNFPVYPFYKTDNYLKDYVRKGNLLQGINPEIVSPIEFQKIKSDQIQGGRCKNKYEKANGIPIGFIIDLDRRSHG
jgi:hypothetical protein